MKGNDALESKTYAKVDWHLPGGLTHTLFHAATLLRAIHAS
jgi:hypothetical protein